MEEEGGASKESCTSKKTFTEKVDEKMGGGKIERNCHCETVTGQL